MRLFQAYVTAALWSSTDDDGTPLDSKYTSDDVAAETLDRMLQDCKQFAEQHADLIEESELTDEQVGHDFWLTRNRHGAGFWDRRLGEVGERLTEAAHKFREFDLYVGDDGLIYGSP